MQDDAQLLYCCACHGLLRRPVLWSCLHGCCRKCSRSLFAAAQAAGSVVACPACDTVVDAADVVENALITARVDDLRRSAAANRVTTCDMCRDDEVDSIARHWCAGCCQSLCDGCRVWHDKFNKDHALVPVDLDEQSSSLQSSLGSGGSSGLCPAHRSPHEFFCFDCARLKCSACVKECLEARHDSSGVTSERVCSHAASLSESLRAQLTPLEERLGAVARLVERAAAVRDVEAAEDACLGASYQLALDAVSRTFELALKDLNAAYDLLGDSAASDAAARAAPLAARLTHAFKYSSALLDAASTEVGEAGGCAAAVDSMLVQRKVVLACVDSLSQEASCLPHVAAETEMTLLESQQDERLRDVAFRFMGGSRSDRSEPGSRELGQQPSASHHRATPSADRLSGSAVQTGAGGGGGDYGGARNSASLLGSTASGDSVAVWPPSIERRLGSFAGESSSSGWTAETVCERPRDEEALDTSPATLVRASAVAGSMVLPAVLAVQDVTDSFRAVATCHDVAVTGDGYILLAALENGLKQYEASSGRKRRTWYPSGSGRLRIVSTVDALANGRVAVGLIGARCVVLLQRAPPDGWLEERRIAMEKPPYRIALHGDQFAVASANVRETGKSCGWTPGPHLSVGVVPASDVGSPLSVSRTLGYDILAIALVACDAATAAAAAAVVVVSSHDKQRTSSGVQRFVVEAYGDGGAGSCLWQCELSEDVFDLCAPPSSSVVYMALPKSKRVAAISGRDGSLLADVLAASTHSLVTPNRLAFSLTPERKMLAVLSGNGTVALYPIA